MNIKTSLTNEKIRDRFDNPFALVNYAIQLAKKRIERGEGLEANPVNEILETIIKREDIYSLDDSEEDFDDEDYDEDEE